MINILRNSAVHQRDSARNKKELFRQPQGGGAGSEAISFRSFLPDCKNNDRSDDHQQVNSKDNDGQDPDVTKMFLQVNDCMGH